MSQSAELGLDRAEHPVIRVACVASRIGRHAMILSFATIRFFAVICQTVKAPLVLRCPPRFGAQVKAARQSSHRGSGGNRPRTVQHQ